MLTKNGTTNIGTGALCVLVVPMLHVASITQLKIMSMTIVFNQTTGDLHKRLKLLLYTGQIQWSRDPCFLTLRVPS
jgi:hypothetical protein